MGKRILVLSASPRQGGNSDILCDEFIRGAAEGGTAVRRCFCGIKRSATAPAAACGRRAK